MDCDKPFLSNTYVDFIYCWIGVMRVSVRRLVATPSTKGMLWKSNCQYSTSPQGRWWWVWPVVWLDVWLWLWWLISLWLWLLCFFALGLGLDRLISPPPLISSPPLNCSSMFCKVGRLTLQPSLSQQQHQRIIGGDRTRERMNTWVNRWVSE